MLLEKSTHTGEFLRTLSSTSSKNELIPMELMGRALQYLESQSIPNAKSERYRYCNPEAFLRKEFKQFTNQSEELGKTDLKSFFYKDSINLVVLNGVYRHDLSDAIHEEGIYVSQLTTDKINGVDSEFDDFFEALNIAYALSGVFVEIAESAQIGKPVHLIFIQSNSSPSVINSLSKVVMNQNSSATINESYYFLSQHASFLNNQLQILVNKNATLKNQRIESLGEKSYLLNTTKVCCLEHSTYTSFTSSFEGQWIRNNLSIEILGSFAEVQLNGLLIANDFQTIDSHTLVDHQLPNCFSSELYKGMAAGKSTIVFNGKIFVRKDAQKTNAYQSSKNMLLSDEATVNSKPELEIYANDVKCSHGTSTGKLDEQAMFYLKSRGLGEGKARKLLLHAFASDLVNDLHEDEFRVRLETCLQRALDKL